MVYPVPAHIHDQRVGEGIPRRILMTADPIGGVWSYALELARGLGGYGVEIALATMGQPLSGEQRREVEDEPNVTLFESKYLVEWMEDPWDDVQQSGEWLLSLESQLHPDLVHLNGYAHAALPWRSPCLVVAHSCMVSWWEAVRGEDPPPGFDPYRRCVMKGLAAADMVIAPTAAMLQSVQKLYLPLSKTRVIYNACSRTRFRPGRKKNFILSVGRLWDEAKNIGALARTAYDLPWPIYVAGEQTRPQGGTASLEGVNRLGLLAPEDLVPWYSAASIYALPARYEPFGLTILEAAQSACALVLGDIPTLRELWDGAAVFVPPDDDAALERELHALCSDPSRVADLGEKALTRSRTFNANKMTSGYLAAYCELTQH